MRPWWADGAWEFVKGKLDNNSIVFEWGSGSSTECVSKICKIISIENDEKWYYKLKDKIKHVDLKFIPDGGSSNNNPEDIEGYSSASALFYHLNFREYVISIDSYKHDFDLIIIDGRSRTSCLKHAVNKIKNGGLLLLDDSWRSHYQPGIDLIPIKWKRHDFKSVEHFTSVWVKQ